MKSVFQQKKTDILRKFNTENLDASPKGSPDEDILDLLNLINSHAELVTTSSCSGRMSVYVESEIAHNIGGKGGGGKWLMVKHEPWDIPAKNSMVLKELFGKYSLKTSDSKNSEKGRLIHFKFEPMILHILAKTVSTARTFLTTALSCSFRESGLILSKKNIVIAVRSSIGFSCPIGYLRKEQDIEFIQLLVNESYLYLLIDMANKRFKENKKRKEKLYKSIASWITEKSKINMEDNNGTLIE
ncbi:unnamed protein product [Pneumocystis jirovecii]|uniref:tRNA wybutosine-synthesizing protein 3 n=2 Tax=Pneumocystis jirovecii TaxID=42068 RepID=L0PF35_PNEJI|nr:tRNA methyltransferase TYW3 [Pneumocystis jirovecii RU7]KTW29524.1 hypothetical protein T551_02140 [Pneumocystis jirovecii RU7]CCJ30689.1 unnamed protein product [Pneumocystis jirovecii]